jgi:hypothetical protein
MKRLDQRGAINAWLIAFIVTLFITLIALGFGLWAFSGRQEYNNKVDEKVAIAVEDAETANSLKKDAEFAEKDKNLFLAPGAMGMGAIYTNHGKAIQLVRKVILRVGSKMDWLVLKLH